MAAPSQPDERPRVGVAVIVTAGNRVLFGQREQGDAESLWQLPGGWIELSESPEQTARREVAEETGLQLDQLRLVALTNNVFSPSEHSISLYFEAACVNPVTISNREPEKCRRWVWKEWQDIGENLYFPLQLLKNTDYRPFSPDKGRILVSF